MFWNRDLKDQVKRLQELSSKQTQSITNIVSLLESFHKRLELQQSMINSLSKQIDIIAAATLFKDAKRAEEIANSKPKMVKPSNENT